MPVDAEVRGQLARRFEVLLPHLNERQQRLALATEARLLGHGGVIVLNVLDQIFDAGLLGIDVGALIDSRQKT